MVYSEDECQDTGGESSPSEKQSGPREDQRQALVGTRGSAQGTWLRAQ